MSTNTEKSFIARISSDNAPAIFVDQHPIQFPKHSDHILTTAHAYSEIAESMVPYDGGNDDAQGIVAYFRCYGDYYNIQIRSAQHFGYFISKGRDGLLGAYFPAGGDTTSYNLVDSRGRYVTLDQFTGNRADIRLKARNDAFIKRKLRTDPNIYLYGEAPGESVTFTLNILERNVDYPTSTRPYS